jgi:hypothetical protein
MYYFLYKRIGFRGAAVPEIIVHKRSARAECESTEDRGNQIRICTYIFQAGILDKTFNAGYYYYYYYYFLISPISFCL